MTPMMKFMYGVAGLCVVLVYVPINSAPLIYVKIVASLLLLGGLYRLLAGGGGGMEKKVQILVKDVSDDRKDGYREKLLAAAKPIGEAVELTEDPGEVAIAVTLTGPVETVKKAVDACRLKMNFESLTTTLRYSSLEAAAQMMTMINGTASPGSEIRIEGVRGTVSTDASGRFCIQVPMSLYEKNRGRGSIPAKCTKGGLTTDLNIPLPR